MLKLTQELFGADDPELARGASRGAAWRRCSTSSSTSTRSPTTGAPTRPTTSRRSSPTPTIDGEPIGDAGGDLGYYVIIATAGHDTTARRWPAGCTRCIEHPDQLQRLQDDPSLIPTAVDEIIRWVSPVKHFMRTATTTTSCAACRSEPGDVGAAVVPVGQPRRGGLRRPDPLRRRPRPEQAPRLRLRRALLPRGASRPDGAQGAAYASCSRGCARSSSPASRATCRPSSSAARSTCRSATRSSSGQFR